MFLSIDGLDGSGKSTVSQELAGMMLRESGEVVVIEHPG